MDESRKMSEAGLSLLEEAAEAEEDEKAGRMNLGERMWHGLHHRRKGNLGLPPAINLPFEPKRRLYLLAGHSISFESVSGTIFGFIQVGECEKVYTVTAGPVLLILDLKRIRLYSLVLYFRLCGTTTLRP